MGSVNATNDAKEMNESSATATASTSTFTPETRPRPLLPQPSFAPIPLTRSAPIPTPAPAPRSGTPLTLTPDSGLYQCPLRHLSLRLASGRSTAYQSRNDPSTSFYIYLPSSHPVARRWHGDEECHGSNGDRWDGYGVFKVVVLIHGSVRDAERLRNSWAERAEREGVVIVAPLWPGRVDVRILPFHDGSALSRGEGQREKQTLS